MTGPEHYREAEHLLEDGFFDAGADPELAARDLARAQVHATLALAAATALNDSAIGMGETDTRAWAKVAGGAA